MLDMNPALRIKEKNDNGERFADLCLENGLVIGGYNGGGCLTAVRRVEIRRKYAIQGDARRRK